MNELININGHQYLDSRDVAQMIGKTHAHLMRDIKKYVADIIEKDNPNLDYGSTSTIKVDNFFIPNTFNSENGRAYKCYLLTKQGCEFVANKLTGKKGNQFTAQYVTLFNQMETHIKKAAFDKPDSYMIDDPIKRASRWIEERKAYELLLPKAKYFDQVMRNPGLMTATEIAKDYGWSAVNLNKQLANLKIIYRQGKRWVIYQKYSGLGYTQYEPYNYSKNDGHKGVHNNLKWTQKGKKFIYDQLKKIGILPTLEMMDLMEKKQ